jgi:hypothetical protein
MIGGYRRELTAREKRSKPRDEATESSRPDRARRNLFDVLACSGF